MRNIEIIVIAKSDMIINQDRSVNGYWSRYIPATIIEQLVIIKYDATKYILLYSRWLSILIN